MVIAEMIENTAYLDAISLRTVSGRLTIANWHTYGGLLAYLRVLSLRLTKCNWHTYGVFSMSGHS